MVRISRIIKRFPEEGIASWWIRHERKINRSYEVCHTYETDKVEAQYRANVLNVGAYAKNICILNRKG